MISSTVEPQKEKGDVAPGRILRVSPGLWLAAILVFAAQIGLLFWVGNPPPFKPPAPPPGPKIHLDADGSQEWLSLQDPTLFVLPHRENFSGAAWVKIKPLEFTPTNWDEPPRPLPLAQEQLGATFTEYMQTNLPPRFQPELNAGSGFADVNVPTMESISVPSAMRVEGDLANLRLLTPLRLPPQTNADLLTNTIIQLLVDSRGNPFSTVILSGSGSVQADAEALTNYAKAVRFQPAEQAEVGSVPSDKMTLGRLIFEWQTKLPAPTNSPTANL